VRRVELDVACPEARELLDLLAQDLRDVFEKAVEGRVGLPGELRRPKVGVEAGAR
jgi:hypothetical protein